MRKLIIFAFSLLILMQCSKKEQEPIVARVGDTKITVSEFHDRYEFTPHIMMTRNKARNKRNFFISLLGEKVFSEEGYHRKWDENEKFKTYVKQMEKEAVVEALFDKEITSKIEVSIDELKQAYAKSKRELQLQVLHFDNKEDALKAKKLIAAGKSFHEVKQQLQTQDFISADSVLTLPLKWGEGHPDIEDAAYRLKMNEVSDIIPVQGEYFILKLVNQTSHVFLTEADFYQQIPSLKKIIRRRKSGAMFDEFLHSVMKDRKLKVSHEVFNFVVDELAKVYGIEKQNDKPEIKADTTQRVEPLPASGTLADHLDDTFARFDDGEIWTIGDFIKMLSVGPYPVNRKSKEEFRRSLRYLIRRMAEFETLARRGYDEGMQKTHYVKYQTQMWSDAYMAQIVRGSIIDTVKVSDEEVEYYYKTHPQNYMRPEMLKLREILVDDLSLAKRLYRRIQQGEDMAKLARKYSKRDLSREKGGVAGFFTTQAWGEIGKVATKLKPGELGGPVKTKNGQYSIFKLIKKLPHGVIPLEETYNDVKKDALKDKRERELDKYLMQFAEKYDIKIFPAVYDTIKTYDLSMLVLKRHYPNRLVAPTVNPLFTSYRWQNKMDKVFPAP